MLKTPQQVIKIAALLRRHKLMTSRMDSYDDEIHTLERYFKDSEDKKVQDEVLERMNFIIKEGEYYAEVIPKLTQRLLDLHNKILRYEDYLDKRDKLYIFEEAINQTLKQLTPMAENKKSFILYCDMIHTVSKMPDDKAGQLLKHILDYVNDKNPITEDLIIQLTFEPIRQQLKRDLRKWQEYSKKQSDNGKLGGRPKSQQKPNKAMGSLANPKKANLTQPNPTKAKKAVSVNVNANDNVNVYDNKTLLMAAKPETVIAAKIIKSDLDTRKNDFLNSLEPFLKDYEQEMLKEFFEYWTEHGLRDLKMRFEKEKSFGLSRRLSTWKIRSKTYNTKKPSALENFENSYLDTE